MNQQHNFLSLLLVLLTSISFAQDMNQLLPFQESDEPVNIKNKEDSQYEGGKSPFLSFEGDEPKLEERKYDEEESAFLGSPKQQKFKKTDDFNGTSLTGTQEKSANYIEYKNKDILNDYRYKSKDRINFAIYYDSFDYKNADDNFNRTYRDSKKIDVYGQLYISYDRYLNRNIFSFTYGAGFGVGFNGGKGIFQGESLENDDSYDDTANFSLWTIPLDLRLGMELMLGPYISLSLSGGPSVLGLIQNRTDLEETNSRKTRRQMSYGYYGIGALKFNIGYIMSDLGFKVLSKDKVNRFYMNLEARTQSYTNFKSEDVSIDGTSFGLGFTYDFI